MSRHKICWCKFYLQDGGQQIENLTNICYWVPYTTILSQHRNKGFIISSNFTHIINELSFPLRNLIFSITDHCSLKLSCYLSFSAISLHQILCFCFSYFYSFICSCCPLYQMFYTSNTLFFSVLEYGGHVTGLGLVRTQNSHSTGNAEA